MKVFVTGAAGFVGAHTVEALLDRQHEVIALVSPSSRSPRLDFLRDRIRILHGRLETLADWFPALRDLRADACVHLAWYAEPGKYLSSPLNVRCLTASLALLENLLRIGCTRVLMAGTCAEYDTDDRLLEESGPVRPATLYATTKLALAMIGEHLASAAGACFSWARFFHLYGPGEDQRRLVPSLISALRANRAFPATAGTQVRDYLHARDAARALVTLLERSPGGIYNVCSAQPVTVRSVIEILADLAHKPHLPRFGEIPLPPWEAQFVCGDNHRIRDLGWEPEFGLREGLEMTYRWWSNQAVASAR